MERQRQGLRPRDVRIARGGPRIGWAAAAGWRRARIAGARGEARVDSPRGAT